MYHSLDETAIVTVSTFTGQRCHVELPSWVGSVAEAILIVREAHSNAYVDDSGKAHYHPAIDYLEDTASGQVIETLSDLRAAREVRIHTKPRTANTSSWFMMVSTETAPDPLTENNGELNVSLDAATETSQEHHTYSSACVGTEQQQPPAAETERTPPHVPSMDPSFGISKASVPFSTVIGVRPPLDIEQLIKYHQRLRSDVYARHQVGNVVDLRDDRNSPLRNAQGTHAEDLPPRPSHPTVLFSPAQQLAQGAVEATPSPLQLPLISPSTGDHRSMRRMSPSTHLQSTTVIQYRLEERSEFAGGVAAHSTIGVAFAYVSEGNVEPHPLVTSSPPPTRGLRALPTSPMPDVVEFASTQPPDHSTDVILDNPDALESRDPSPVHLTQTSGDAPASLTSDAVPQRLSTPLPERIEYSPANSDEAPVDPPASEPNPNTETLCDTHCQHQHNAAPPQEPVGIRAPSAAHHSPTPPPPQRGGRRYSPTMESSSDTAEEGVASPLVHTTGIMWPAPAVVAHVDVAEVNARRYRSLEYIRRQWGVVASPSLLFREVITEAATTQGGCSDAAVAAGQIRGLQLVVEGPSGSGATTAAIVVVGDVILATQQQQGGKSASLHEPVAHVGHSLIVPVQVLRLVDAHPTMTMSLWLAHVAATWLRDALHALDAAMGGVSLDVDGLVAVVLPIKSGGVPERRSPSHHSVSSCLVTALQALCPSLPRDHARRSVDDTMHALSVVARSVAAVVSAQGDYTADAAAWPQLLDEMLVLASAMHYVPVLLCRLFGWSGVLYVVDGWRGAYAAATEAVQTERHELLMVLLRMVLVDDSTSSTYVDGATLQVTGMVYCRHISWGEALARWHHRYQKGSTTFMHEDTDMRALLLGSRRLDILGIVPDAVATTRYGFPALLRVHRPTGHRPRDASTEGHAALHYPLRVFLGAPGFLSLLYRHVVTCDQSMAKSADWVLPLSGDDADVLCELVDVCALTLAPPPRSSTQP